MLGVITLVNNGQMHVPVAIGCWNNNYYGHTPLKLVLQATPFKGVACKTSYYYTLSPLPITNTTE